MTLNQGEPVVNGGVVPVMPLTTASGETTSAKVAAIHHVGVNKVIPIGHAVQVGVYAKRLLDKIAGG